MLKFNYIATTNQQRKGKTDAIRARASGKMYHKINFLVMVCCQEKSWKIGRINPELILM